MIVRRHGSANPSKLVPGAIVCVGSERDGALRTIANFVDYFSGAYTPIAVGALGIVVSGEINFTPALGSLKRWLLLMNDGKLCWTRRSSSLTIVGRIVGGP